jgi:hypothetical protein
MDMSYFEKAHEKYQNEYDALCESTLTMMELDGVIVSTALKNQVHLQLVWESMVRGVSNLHDHLEAELEGLYSEAVETELRDSYKSSKITEAREFAKANKAYRAARRLLFSVRETRDYSKGILDTINSRKYILNNLSNLIVHGSESYML